MFGELTGFCQAVNLVHRWFQQGYECPGKGLERLIGGNEITVSQVALRSLRSLGTSPARTTDDLPLPDAPTTAQTVGVGLHRASLPMAASRPKKNEASSSRK